MKDAFNGIPTPDWSMQGTDEQLKARLGSGFEFMGEGWYEGPDRTVLITPLQFEMDTEGANMLERLTAILGIRTMESQEDQQYACYAWSMDPRPVMAAAIRLEDQTEVAVPQLLRDGWAQVQATGTELKAWGDVEIARIAANHGAPTIEVPEIGPCPPHFTKKQVKVNDAGVSSFKISPYVIHVMNLDQQRMLVDAAAAHGGIPPYARLFSIGDVGVVMSFSPA